jgi:hypothetical protein
MAMPKADRRSMTYHLVTAGVIMKWAIMAIIITSVRPTIPQEATGKQKRMDTAPIDENLTLTGADF